MKRKIFTFYVATAIDFILFFHFESFIAPKYMVNMFFSIETIGAFSFTPDTRFSAKNGVFFTKKRHF